MRFLPVSASFTVSLLLHASLGTALVAISARPAETKKIIKFAVVKEEKKEAPKPEPPKPPPPPPPPKPKPKITKPIDLTKPQPKAPPKAEQPLEQPKPAEQPPPVNFGVDASLTSGQGGFAVQVGATAMADPELVKKQKKAAEVAPAPKEFAPVPVARVTRMPELVADFKVPYPEEARRQGIEGKVVLQLDIDETGKVIKAKVVKGAGFGLDEAAVQAAHKFRFKPAIAESQPVPVRILYTYRFVLEE